MEKRLYCYIKRSYIPKNGRYCIECCTEYCKHNPNLEGIAIPDGRVPR